MTTADSGSSFTLPSYDGVREGMEFKGWKVGSSILQPGESFTVTGDVTVTAVWQEPTIQPGGDDEPTDPSEETPGDDSLFEMLILLAIVIVVIVLALYAYHVHGNGDGGNRRR